MVTKLKKLAFRSALTTLPRGRRRDYAYGEVIFKVLGCPDNSRLVFSWQLKTNNVHYVLVEYGRYVSWIGGYDSKTTGFSVVQDQRFAGQRRSTETLHSSTLFRIPVNAYPVVFCYKGGLLGDVFTCGFYSHKVRIVPREAVSRVCQRIYCLDSPTTGGFTDRLRDQDDQRLQSNIAVVFRSELPGILRSNEMKFGFELIPVLILSQRLCYRMGTCGFERVTGSSYRSVENGFIRTSVSHPRGVAAPGLICS
ncbi:hypothetical protein Tco_0712722 [Tanacetum coccineum]